MSKSILQIIQSCSVQKTARKNTKYSRNESILKIGQKTALKNTKYSRNEIILKIMQSLQPMKNPHFKSKIKIAKNMSKSIRQIIQSFFVQKTALKNTKYSRNETMKIHENRPFKSKIKIAKHITKSILQIIQKARKNYSPWKILTLGQKLKLQNTCQNPFYKSFRVVLCKKPLEKTPNIREMRLF